MRNPRKRPRSFTWFPGLGLRADADLVVVNLRDAAEPDRRQLLTLSADDAARLSVELAFFAERAQRIAVG